MVQNAFTYTYLRIEIFHDILYFGDKSNKKNYKNKTPAEKNDRHRYKISNGFTGYGTCTGFTGNCNGPCWSLIGCLLLVAC